MTPRKILIVEDDRDLAKFYVDLLELSGHQVVGCAADGRQAVEQYAALGEPPDVVLMDYRMPEMNGLEATREIMRRDPRARIIFVSADDSIAAEALAAGVMAFELKAVAIGKLLDSIERATQK